MLVSADTSTESCQRPAFMPLEPGTYDLLIQGTPKFQPSKTPAKDGKNYGSIAVTYKEVVSGKELRDWISLNPVMAWRKNSFFKSLNAPINNGQVDLADLTGLSCRAVITQKTAPKKDAPGQTVQFNEISEYVYA